MITKLSYGLFCFLFFMLALPASAQETPPVTQDSQTEQTEVVTADQSESSQTTDSVGIEVGEVVATESETTTAEIDETEPSIEVDTATATDPSVEYDETVESDSSFETDISEATVDTSVETEATFTSTSLPRVFISEVNWAGSELSQADEWLEITNADGQAVDLSGWILTGCASSGNAIAIADSTMLAAGDTLLISNYDLGSDKTTLTVQPDLVTASISLSNSALEILLVMPDGTVIDQAGNGGTPPAGLTSPKTSMVRDLSTLAWIDSTSSTNLSDATQLGNPGTLVMQVADEQVASDESETEAEDPTTTPTLRSTELLSGTADPSLEKEGDPQTGEPDQESTCSLIINEFVSDPNTDEQEWIEIYNPCDSGIDLTGWAVRDATQKETALDEVELSSDSYSVVTKPLGQLNNNGDTIELVNADKQVIDSVTYGEDPESPSKGWSLARDNQGVWAITCTPTPGFANELIDACVEPEETTESDQQVQDESDTSDTTQESETQSDTDDQASASDTSDQAESDAQSDASDTPLSYSPDSLILSEIVSDPAEGDTEWIEIFNPGNTNIDLTGWTITDASEKKTELDGFTIEPETYLVIENPKGKLNNDGDTVSLFDPAGNLINSISYGTDDLDNPNKGESLVWNGSNWTITSNITKSIANQISYEDQTNESDTESNTESGQKSTSTTESSTSNTGNDSQSQYTPVSDNQQTSSGNDSSVSNQPETHRVVAIAQSPSTTTSTKSSSSSSTKSSTSKSSKITKVSGVVTATPGTFGSQIAFIEGMQLYFYYADWPMLEAGDIVTVSGELSESRGEQRIKISDLRDIEVTGHTESDAQSSLISDLSDEKDGTLITIEGTVGTIQDTKLNLFDGTGSIIIVANTHEGMNWNTAGTQMRVTGVLRTVSGEQRLYPRTMQDVTDLTPVAQSSEPSQTIAVGQTRDYTPWIGGGLLAVALAGFAYFFVRRPRLETAPMGA